MTLKQFYSVFKRIEYFKSYDTTTLYKTVDTKDSIKVIDWTTNYNDKSDEVLLTLEEAIDTNRNILAEVSKRRKH